MKTNKVLAIVLAVAMVLSSMTIGVFAADSVWDGTASTDWYENTTGNVYTLTTAEDLAGLAQLVNAGNTFSKKTVVLAESVDLNNVEWTPIGKSTNKFQGTFDGKGNTISNLNVNMPGKSNAGLFGFTTDGEVKNLVVENAKVVGRLNVGTVSGTPYTSKYTNITVKGLVQVDGMSYVGGVLGKDAYADVTNVHMNANDGSYVKAYSIENGSAYRTYVGGVIGFMGEGGHTVSNVSSNIAVYGSTIDVGGIVGIAHYGNAFENITCTAPVIAVTDCDDTDDLKEVGGIAGVWHDGGSAVNMVNCTVDDTTTIKATDSKGNAIAYNFAAQKVTGASYSGKSDAETAKKLNAPTDKYAAKIDKVYYKTFDEALANATAKDTIQLIADVEYAGRSQAEMTQAKAIDLMGNTLTINTQNVYFGPQMTFVNGVIDVATTNINGNAIFWMHNTEALTFDGVTINAENVRGTYLIDLWNNSTLTVKNGSKINVKTANENGLAAIIAGNTAGTTDIIDSEINAENIEHVFLFGKDITIGGDSEINASNVGTGFYTNDGTSISIEDNAKLNITTNGVVPSYSAVTLATNASYTVADTATVNAEVKRDATAKIGDVYYKTLDEAIEKAVDGDEIDLLGGVALVREGHPINKNITIKNGTIDITGCAPGGEGIFKLGERNGSYTMTLTGVNLTGSDYASAAGIFRLFNDSVLNVTDMVVTLTNDKSEPGGVFKGYDGTETFNLTNVNMTLNGTQRIIANAKGNINNLTVNATNIGNHALRNFTGTISNSDINVDGCETGIKMDKGKEITLVNTDIDISNAKNNQENSGIVLLGGRDQLKDDEDSTVNAFIYVAPTGTDEGTNNLAAEVAITFEPTDSVDTFNIYVESTDGGVINRLSAAQLKFLLSAVKGGEKADMSYTLSPATDVTITEDLGFENAYVFNYNGVNEKDRTGTKLLLGAVKFEGVGTYTFAIDGTYKNQVHTATLSDNIEVAYVPNTAKNLVITNTASAEIVEATRTINVVIAFNNEIMEKNAAYTEMSVTVAGGADNQAVTKTIGTDGDVAIDATGDVVTATVPFEVTVPYRYTVTVKGAGYRTATYTTVVGKGADENDVLTLNFWNNVKDSNAEIEEDEARSAMTKNFLAGDIVKDNTINKYDLSAVVSYFGTRQAATSLNKYDLNRDGNIDSEDIAYVLVSFGE